MSPFSRSLVVPLLPAALVVSFGGRSVGQPPHTLPQRSVVVPDLQPPSPTEIEAARVEAATRLRALRRDLADQAIGVVLARELDLDGLEVAIVAPPEADAQAGAAVLERHVSTLARSVPRSLQPAVNDLRATVRRLAQHRRLAADAAGVAAAALATLTIHRALPELRTTEPGEAELRAAFAQAAATVPDDVLDPLRREFSQPNDVGFVSRDFIAFLARQHFEQPVEFSRSVDEARIVGSGVVEVDLSATVPVSQGENHLRIHARGSGTIAATADRRRVHVRATALPSIVGTQSVHIMPHTITGDTPDVAATFRTQLEGVRIDGALGRCRLVQRVAGRAIGGALAANDPRVAATLAEAVRERVREEGLQLAHRINGLLRASVWEQLRAVDYEPVIALYNDTAGMWSATTYAHDDELGALGPRPSSPAAHALDLVRWIHESAVTNALGGLAGATIDEATVRGLWETQFKLSSPTWDALPGGRVPAVIRLAPDRPLAIRFRPDGVVLHLRAAGCAIDGREADAGPRSFQIHYHVETGADGIRLTRSPLTCGADVPESVRPLWESVLDHFCATDIRPLPRFPNRLARQILTLGFLDAVDGWLIIGLRRPPVPAAAQQAAVIPEPSR